MRVFASRAEAGAELAPLVRAVVAAPVVVIGVAPHGMPVAEQVATALGLVAQPVALIEHADGLLADRMPPTAGCTAVVVDDGVETGSAARAIAEALRESGAQRTVLAVPVCPRQALATLRLAFDEVIAIDIPLARRSLRWHYADWGDVQIARGDPQDRAPAATSSTGPVVDLEADGLPS